MQKLNEIRVVEESEQDKKRKFLEGRKPTFLKRLAGLLTRKETKKN